MKNRIQIRKLLFWLPDKLYLELLFWKRMGKRLNLHNPESFNEKLQWIKLYDRNPLYSIMVDKYLVKEYVADKIGKQYIVKTYGCWKRFDDIDFDSLPNRFVLKCTHDSGTVVICRDKNHFDYKAAKEIIELSLATDFYLLSREWPYKNVPHRVIAEEYLEEKVNSAEGKEVLSHNNLKDYKFFCFDGEVKCFKIDFDRFVYHRANYYDLNGNLLKFGEASCPPDYSKDLTIPSTLGEMMGLAQKLSTGIPFVRVDFYSIDNNVYFGELTFFPAAGFGKFVPENGDMLLGKWLNLPGN